MTPSHYLRPGKFEIIAHRGGSLEAPENTLEAFAHAREVYTDAIFELDVHLTKDGQVVVIHDDRIDRTTNGIGFVRDFTLSELQKFDAGFRFSPDGGQSFPFRGKNVKIPTLEEVLRQFRENRVSIEIKISDVSFGKAIFAVVDRNQARSRVVIAGANHHDLTAARRGAGDVCSGYSAKEVFWSVLWLRLKLGFLAPTRGQVYQVPQKSGKREVVTEQFVKAAHARGKHVHVWTINDEATMRHLLELRVDGIITDAPRLLVQVARAFKKI